jgi:hypothetical protein
MWQDLVAKAIARVPKLAIGGVFTPDLLHLAQVAFDLRAANSQQRPYYSLVSQTTG